VVVIADFHVVLVYVLLRGVPEVRHLAAEMLLGELKIVRHGWACALWLHLLVGLVVVIALSRVVHPREVISVFLVELF
jgi:hypothetical protein